MKVVMSLMMTVMMTVVTLGPELGSGSGQKPSVGRHSYCWYLSPSTLEFLYFALKFLLLVSSFMLLGWLLSASNLKRWFQIHFEGLYFLLVVLALPVLEFLLLFGLFHDRRTCLLRDLILVSFHSVLTCLLCQCLNLCL